MATTTTTTTTSTAASTSSDKSFFAVRKDFTMFAPRSKAARTSLPPLAPPKNPPKHRTQHSTLLLLEAHALPQAPAGHWADTEVLEIPSLRESGRKVGAFTPEIKTSAHKERRELRERRMARQVLEASWEALGERPRDLVRVEKDIAESEGDLKEAAGWENALLEVRDRKATQGWWGKEDEETGKLRALKESAVKNIKPLEWARALQQPTPVVNVNVATPPPIVEAQPPPLTRRSTEDLDKEATPMNSNRSSFWSIRSRSSARTSLMSMTQASTIDGSEIGEREEMDSGSPIIGSGNARESGFWRFMNSNGKAKLEDAVVGEEGEEERGREVLA